MKNNKDPNKWISTYYRKFKNPTISFRISPASYFDNRAMIHIDLLWVSWYIHLPLYSNTYDCDYPEFGFYYHMNSLVLCWNMKKKFIRMPWDLVWIRTSKLRKDNTWYVESAKGNKQWKKENPNKSLSSRWEWEKEQEKELWSETHHYYYKTKYNEEQNDVEATIGVEEMEWRPRWFKWTKLFAMVTKSIRVEFSNEVGLEIGSWKGGVLGCSYDMLPGETPYETLMRMQKETTFDR